MDQAPFTQQVTMPRGDAYAFQFNVRRPSVDFASATFTCKAVPALGETALATLTVQTDTSTLGLAACTVWVTKENSAAWPENFIVDVRVEYSAGGIPATTIIRGVFTITGSAITPDPS